MRILLTLQYLGTRYAGWQAQDNAVGIQTIVETALTRLYQTPLRIEGAGRTDSGVHAAAQRAHFDAPLTIPERGLVMGVNDLLPHDIRVLSAEPVAADFHCRFAAKSKTYTYRIWNESTLDVFHWETFAHAPSPLNESLMNDAARALIGTHDFRAFTVLEPEVSSTMRMIESIGVFRTGSEVTIKVTADGFLRFMVRRIAGSLIEIGRGKIDGESVGRSLEPRFEAARWTAPAKGLTLESIEYPSLPATSGGQLL